jgi:hypothetical protein
MTFGMKRMTGELIVTAELIDIVNDWRGEDDQS